MHTSRLDCNYLGLLLMLSLALAACGRADSFAPQSAGATATEAPASPSTTDAHADGDRAGRGDAKPH